MNIAPLIYKLSKYRIIKPGVIEGHWNEDGTPFEIHCPAQLQEMLLHVLNTLEVENMTINKSTCADTRTCDFTKVSREQLLQQSKQHIEDVQKGLDFLMAKIRKSSSQHDRTKISHLDDFFVDFRTGFKNTSWWEMHQKEERHHFQNQSYIKDDVNLIDVLEQITDGVMAGMARSGEWRYEPVSNELLQKAYFNTAKLLLDNLKVV